MIITLAVIFLILVCLAVFGMPVEVMALLMVLLGAVAVAIFLLIERRQRRIAISVVEAELI